MPLLAQLVVEYVADMGNLESAAQRADDLISHFGEYASPVNNLSLAFTQLGESVSQMGTQIAQADTTFDDADDAINALSTSFSGRAVAAAEEFGSKLASLAAPVTDLASDLTDRAGSALTSFSERLRQAALPITDFGERIASGVGTAVSSLQEKLQQGTTAVVSFKDSIVSGTGEIVSRITSPFEQAGLIIAGFSIKAKESVDQAMTTIRERFSTVVTPISNFMSRIREASPPLVEFGEKAMQAVAPVGSFISRLAEGASSLLHFGTSAEEAGSPLQGFGSRIKEAGSNLLELGSKIGMAVIGFQGLVQGAESLGKALFSPNASMEQTRVSFEAFLGVGKTTQDFLNTLSVFAAKTPFEFADAQQGALNLLNMGVAANQVNTYLTDIGDAVSKVGGNGQVFQDVSSIIEKMGVEGKITSETMMQLSDHNIPAFQLLSKAMGVPVGTLQTMISNGEVGKDKIDLLVQSMGKFGSGAMIAQGKTFNGLLSTVKDNASAAWRSFTGPLFDQAKGSLTDIGNLVGSSKFQDFAKGAGIDVGNVITDIGKASKYVSDILRTINLTPFRDAWKSVSTEVHNLSQRFSEVSTNAKPVADAFDPIAETIRGLATGGLKIVTDLMRDFSGVLKTISDGLQGTGPLKDLPGIFQNIKNTVKDLTPYLLDLSPTADIVSSLSDHAKDLGQWFRTSVTPAIKDAEPGFKNLGLAVAGLVDPFKQIATIVSTTFKKAFDDLLPVFEVAVPFIIQLAGIFADILGPAIKFLAPYIVIAAKAIGQFADDIAQRVAPIIIQFITSVQNGVNDVLVIWNAVWPFLAPILKGVWDEIVGVVKIAWAIVSGIVKIGLDILGGNWKLAWTDFKVMLAGIWDGIKTYLHGAWEIIQGIFNDAMQGIHAIFNPIGRWFQDRWNDVVNAFKNAGGWFHDKFTDAYNSIKGAIGNLGPDAAGWMNNMMGSMVDTINSWTQPVRDAIGNIEGVIAGMFGQSAPNLSSITTNPITQVGTVHASTVGLGALIGASGASNIGISGVGASPSSVSASRSAQTVYVVMDSGGSDDHATNVYLDSEVLLKAMTKRERKVTSRRNKH